MDFELLLFSTDPTFIRRAVAGGVDGIILDWERLGKEERQAGADTQIGTDTFKDLEHVRAFTEAHLICRINALGFCTGQEVEAAVRAGADEILLPMVRATEEVEALMTLVNGRCGVGIMVETMAAIERAKELASLPITRVYVGLNDLAIERRSPTIFAAVADGTIERVRSAFRVPFGFGGLTLPDLGTPIPCRLLIAEMARLGCSFSILRRSFHRDIRGRDPAIEVPRLRVSLEEARQRTPDEVERDHQDLMATIGALAAAPA
jgi:hypothetical protein